MSLRTEIVVSKVCGNYMHAKGDPSLPAELRKLERAYARYETTYDLDLSFLRGQATHLRDANVFCRKENTEMGIFEEACALWKKNKLQQLSAYLS